MPAFQGVPIAPRAVPLLGHAIPLLRDPLGFMSSLPAHGPLVTIVLGPRPAVVACDPAVTNAVLRDGHTFDKGGLVYERAGDLLGNGLGTCPHAQHRRQRRLCQPAFHHQSPARLRGGVRGRRTPYGGLLA
ncbi:cytochrome P450 [Streptomyces melanogenes]|uniref:cytochrome P450 n=1 Tax=Streptomyces melanogenes TaxID=67326 RepID=UPI003791FD04